MTNLIIDIGNTQCKIAVYRNRQLVSMALTGDLEFSMLAGIIRDFHINHAIVSSVRLENPELPVFLESAGCRYVGFNAGLTAGIDNQYLSPSTLGLDRLAAVIGARCLLPGRNCLVIDAGTCLTYDFVSQEGVYKGGSISPGLRMRYKSMHAFTDKLPQLEAEETIEARWGRDTSSSMHSGVLNGLLFEALGFINSYAADNTDLAVLLCGGDVKFFDRQLKNSIFADKVKAEPNLVLIGLNEVLHHYNV